jgi:hypothetical protein
VVGLYKLIAVDPWLESAWFQPLNLSKKTWFQSFAFKCSLTATPWAIVKDDPCFDGEVGRCS